MEPGIKQTTPKRSARYPAKRSARYQKPPKKREETRVSSPL
ncbi:hypothetical protein N0824_03897 [Microcystis sp. 0824]|nr:hypothetical protein N0824_03897 [Microcystis sp. 0824]